MLTATLKSPALQTLSTCLVLRPSEELGLRSRLSPLTAPGRRLRDQETTSPLQPSTSARSSLCLKASLRLISLSKINKHHQGCDPSFRISHRSKICQWTQ